LHLRQQISHSEHSEGAVTPQGDRLPGMPIAHETHWRGIGIDAHENEPKSLQSLPSLMCLASHMQAVPVSAKNIASSEAQRCRQEFRADGLEQIALPRVSLYETNLRSVATLVATTYSPCLRTARFKKIRVVVGNRFS
jgi:hypothetical protein